MFALEIVSKGVTIFLKKSLNSLCVKGRSCGLVAQRSECSHGMREVLGLRPGRAMCFYLSCDIWWLSVGPFSAASSKGIVSSFRHGSKQIRGRI